MLDNALYSEYPFYGAFDADHHSFDPNKPHIKDILWNNFDWIYNLYVEGKIRPCVLENVERTLLCNTVYLGYDYFECPQCGNWELLFHKCHSRFCNSCGVKAQKIIAQKAAAMAVDVPHRHIVFTIPKSYRRLFRKDRSALNLLFVAARNTISIVFNRNLLKRERRKAAMHGKPVKNTFYAFHNFDSDQMRNFGAIAAIHTFGRDLKWNPHIHMLVAEMYYDPKKDKCVQQNYFNFTLLRKTWQFELNRLLSDHFGKRFDKLKNESYKEENNGFYVYAKDRDNDEEAEKERNHSKDVQGCVNYIMRYASRPAMAEGRIISYDKDTDKVKWYFDDHKTGQRYYVHGTGKNLLLRMFMHIPDDHFKTIRYYGFYNPKERKTLEHIYELLKQKKKYARSLKEHKRQLRLGLKKTHFRTMCLDSFNRDILRCKCGAIMKYKDSYEPLKGKHNDRKYRENCINEMREMRLRRGSPTRRFGLISLFG